MKAYELLEKANWCQGAVARNIKGETMDANDCRAVSFCAIGALSKIYGCWTREYQTAIERLYHAIYLRASDRVLDYVQGIIDWNDLQERTKQDVIEKMKEVDV